MRTTLLATVAILAFAGPARAQIPVTDGLSIATRAAEAARSLQQAYQQYSMLQQQYQQLVSTYNALSHMTDLSSAVSALGGMSRTYLPPGNSMGEAMSTIGSAAYGNIPGALSGASRFLDGNRVYQSPTQDAWQLEQSRREMTTANAQAMAHQSLLDTDQRMANLAVLQQRLSAAKDVTEVNAVNGLISLEQQNLAIEESRMRRVQLMLASDDRVTQQRAEQRQRESAEQLRAATSPLSGSFR